VDFKMTEKETFTKLRNEQLTQYGKEEIVNFERKWGHVLYTPLDIPVIHDDLFAEWYFEKAKPVVKIKEDVANHQKGYGGFVSVNVFPHGDPDNASIWSINLQPEWFTKFPKMYQQIMDTLPVKTIHNINMWSSTNGVKAHRDHNHFIDIPLAFRIMSHDENPNPTLYTGESCPDTEWIDSNPFFYCKTPKTTNTFVWNNLRTKHGSFHDPSKRKILLILSTFNIDWKKYDLLLEKSISKFKNEYCLTSTRPLGDFVNL
jgi:hypothetical protein